MWQITALCLWFMSGRWTAVNSLPGSQCRSPGRQLRSQYVRDIYSYKVLPRSHLPGIAREPRAPDGPVAVSSSKSILSCQMELDADKQKNRRTRAGLQNRDNVAGYMNPIQRK
ncbi:hypothetical protein DFH08DRAFT_883229 [Mycena albidolilacea]|uniref:Uncharacterized protein n=1 Tax=Mycena albidolilacea TaxID=1033008 RepID=A0AAD6ZM00_9AGAR|nr:hypothetical protein DFH08DRAFT_883229 [Mycena albidolilacea]